MENAIVLNGVSKEYRLGVITGRTLQKDLQSWWAVRRGREDPNSPIKSQQPKGRSSREGERFLALDNINLTIAKGERLGIIGANGAGKSTLLKLLSRVTAPTRGEIDLYGRVSSMLEVGTGFHGEMTGRENIYMNGSILGMSRKEIEDKMEDIIEFSEIGEYIDTPVKRYSSGMFVKLAFSVAAHLTSEIIIMDEVLAVGDMAFQKKCLDRMRSAAENEGRTILYVSHNMNTIRTLCDRCVVLDHGRIVFDGEVEPAIAKYMDYSLGDNEVDIDLTQASHTEADAATRLERIQLVGKATPAYSEGEDLELRLTINSDEAVDSARIRLTLRTNADVGLGTAWSEEFDIERGKSEMTVRMPLDEIAKGIFYASIGIYRTGEIGYHHTLDHITRAFKIEVLGAPVWSTTAHGYMHLQLEIE